MTEPLAVVADGKVFLSELLPAPLSGRQEWIELTNPNDQPVDISGWLLTDASGRKFVFSQGTALAPHEWRTFSKKETRLSLNDDGDAISLVDPQGNILDTATYTHAPRQQSYSRFEKKWLWTSPTPGEPNTKPVQVETPVTQITSSPTSRVEPQRESKKTKIVTVTGIIVAPPGSIEMNSLFVTNVEGIKNITHLRVDSSVLLPPETFAVGDTVRANGKLHTPAEGPYLNVTSADDIVITAAPRQTIEPVDFIATDFQKDIGTLVSAEGLIIQKSSRGFLLGLENNRLSITAPPGISIPYSKGTKVKAVGILTTSAKGPKILLRSLDDLMVQPDPPSPSPQPLNAAKKELPLAPLVAVNGLGLLAASGFYLWRKQKWRTLFTKISAKLSPFFRKHPDFSNLNIDVDDED